MYEVPLALSSAASEFGVEGLGSGVEGLEF